MIEWTDLADADAGAIFDHVILDDSRTAEEIIKRVIAATNRLAQFPDIGRPGREPGTRELILPRLPYIIIYRLSGKTITILRVLHTSRLWPSTALPK